MNTVACVSKVLERIVENMHSVSETQNLISLIDTVGDIGNYTLEKSLPTLLQKVFVILNKFSSYTTKSRSVSAFYDNVNQFCKRKNHDANIKRVLLSHSIPAVESEVLALLNMCTSISKMDELTLVKTAVCESSLPSVCTENPIILHKVNRILKQTFTITKANPVIGYLSFVFNQSVKNVSKSPVPLFSDELTHLDILFSLPQEILCEQEQIAFIKYILTTLVKAVEMSLCEKNDIIFLCSVFPSIYHQVLTFYMNETVDVMAFLRIICNADVEFRTIAHEILGNPVWKYLLES